MDKDRIARIAKTLDISYEEAKEMLEEDKKVDRMKDKDVTNDINEEQKKAIKKYSKCGNTKVDAYGKKTKRVVKADDVKRSIIQIIANALNDTETVENVEITNIQKTIAFKIGADDFEIDLKRKRKKKE